MKPKISFPVPIPALRLSVMGGSFTALECARVGSIGIEVYEDRVAACRAVAKDLAERIRARAAEGRSLVVGLATGSTPIPLYEELVRLHRDEGLSLANVVTFNLDEYLGLPADNPESYHAFMAKHLFDHVDVPASQVHIPEGMVSAAEAADHCREYDEAIAATGGIDVQILGIGHNGHIGFNEPGSPRDSRTRLVQLDGVTREAAADTFGGLDAVPTEALTMGVATIMEAREIILFAWGEGKAEAVARAVSETVSPDMPATFLQEHGSVTFVLDQDSASQLNLS
jgi:glucosamine-6-phosphate deaminase